MTNKAFDEDIRLILQSVNWGQPSVITGVGQLRAHVGDIYSIQQKGSLIRHVKFLPDRSTLVLQIGRSDPHFFEEPIVVEMYVDESSPTPFIYVKDDGGRGRQWHHGPRAASPLIEQLNSCWINGGGAVRGPLEAVNMLNEMLKENEAVIWGQGEGERDDRQDRYYNNFADHPTVEDLRTWDLYLSLLCCGLSKTSTFTQITKVLPSFGYNHASEDDHVQFFKATDRMKVLQWLEYYATHNMKTLCLTEETQAKQMPYDSSGRRYDTIPDLIMILEEDNDPTFAAAAKRHGSVIAFHGTSNQNTHSILHHGLRKLSGTSKMRNGNMLGDGIYLAKDMKVALSFCAAGLAKCFYTNSSFIEDSGRFNYQTVFEAEIITLKEYESVHQGDKDGTYYIVHDERHCRLRRLLLFKVKKGQPDRERDPPTKSPPGNHMLFEMVMLILAVVVTAGSLLFAQAWLMGWDIGGGSGNYRGEGGKHSGRHHNNDHNRGGGRR